MTRQQQTQNALQRHQEILEQLEQSAISVKNSPAYQQMLDWIAKFPQRSPTNTMLIQLQRPGATLCRGYKQWLDHGRQVKKGEHGIAIWRPNWITVEDPETGEKRRIMPKEKPFVITHVFDITQTFVIDEELDKLNDQPLPILEGPDDLYYLLLDFCASQGIDVIKEADTISEGEARWNRRTDERIIVVKANRPPAHRAVVILHELAHMLLHHQHGEEDIPAQQKEWEAESVAYIVATHYGLPSFSDLYLANWQVEPGSLTQHLNRISGAAQRLISAIDQQAAAAPSELARAA